MNVALFEKRHSLVLMIWTDTAEFLSNQTGSKAYGPIFTNIIYITCSLFNESRVAAISWSNYMMFYERDFLQTFVTLTRQLDRLHEINELALWLSDSDEIQQWQRA